MALHPRQKKIIKQFVDEESDRQIAFLTEKLGLIDFDPELFLSFRSDAAASYGGEDLDRKPFIHLALYEYTGYVGDTRLHLYTEYDFIAKNRRIGECYGNWKELTAMLMAHELAHSVCEVVEHRQLAAANFPHYVTKDRRGHGLMWQAVYGELRDWIREQTYEVTKETFRRPGDLEVEQFIEDKIKYLTYSRKGKPVGYFMVKDKVIYRTNDSFGRPRKTKYASLVELRKALT